MEKMLKFKYENIEITANVLSLEVKDDYQGMKNHVTAAYCQLMIKNEQLSEIENAPSYAFVASTRIEFPPANPNTFVTLNELDTNIFAEIISNKVNDNPELIDKIKKVGAVLGLCEAPPKIQQYTAKRIDRRKTNGGLEYNEDGIAIMNLR